MAYQDTEFRRNLWEQFGFWLQSLTDQWSKRKMSEEKDKALDDLIAWAVVVDDCINFGMFPNANTIQNFKAAIEQAVKVNDYKKGEPI